MAPTIYRVDRDDTIVRVNDAWDEFATANEAPDLVGVFVLGRPVWSFVSDSTTRLLYREIMGRVRARRRAVTVPFRCDSPTLKRFMRLTITAQEGGGLEFEAETIRTEPQHAPLWERSDVRQPPPVRTCGWCKRIDAAGEWLEVEEAVARLDLLGARSPMLTHGICDACTAAVMRTLGESSGPAARH